MDSTSVNMQYLKHFPLWTQCRDAYEGQAQVHSAREVYLPRIDINETDKQYLSRLSMSTFFGATQRTVDSMVGSLFRKPMVCNLPDSLVNWGRSVTASKKVNVVSFEQFAQDIAREVILVGRHGVLVDFPNIDTTAMSIKDFNDRGYSVYLKQYTTEDILDWYEEEFEGVNKVTFVKLKEDYCEFNRDTFAIENKKRIRCLLLENGVYKQRVFAEGSSEYKEVIPLSDGKEMNYIPFVFININSNRPEIDKPMLIDMVDINFDHYRTNSDYKFGMHYAALPTPIICGVGKDTFLKDNPEGLSLGPRSAVLLTDPNSKVEYLQPNPQVYKDFREELKVLEDRMAVLGARALITERKQSETADAIQLKSSGEQSVLGKVADSLSNGLTSILRVVDDWLPGENHLDISVKINKDFGMEALTPQVLSEMFKAVQGGKMPLEVYYFNLKRGGYLPDGMSLEKYTDDIEAENENILDKISNKTTKIDKNL